MEPPRILIVDDDSYTRAALDILFSREGWIVATASTVSEALAQLEPAPACMLLDLNLPDGRGEAVLREIRARSLRTRVAVCSGTDDPRRLADVRGLNPELIALEADRARARLPALRVCQGPFGLTGRRDATGPLACDRDVRPRPCRPRRPRGGIP